MKNKILYGIIAIIILTGIVMFFVNGFNMGSIYGSNTRIRLYMENGINKDEIAQIARESFEGKNALIRDVEYFGDVALITLPTVSDEQIDTFITKINEKYELEYTKSNLDIVNVPNVTTLEIVKPYLLPVLITIAISAIYMMVRYRTLGKRKVILKTILTPIIMQALILSIYLITNLPIDVSIIPVSIFGLGVALLYVANDNNRLLENKKEVVEE